MPLRREVGRSEALIAGFAAERAVVRYLLAAGCEILGVNVRVGRLEVDIVARCDRVAMIVEVRTRGSGAWTSALGSIDARKRARVRTAGERLWDRELKRRPDIERLRFDCASVCFGADGAPHVEYVAAAF